MHVKEVGVDHTKDFFNLYFRLFIAVYSENGRSSYGFYFLEVLHIIEEN